jgi:2-dehydro-3-deoxyphosphogluconate aldolase / (4S)-4-hydroxy-2-oxoglutarate aldolase
MLKSEVLAGIEHAGLMAMLRMPSADDALEMAEVLIEAGIPCIEVPLTVPGAVEVIEELRQDHGQVLIGAGTVLDGKAVEGCLRAGAQFIVSPIVDLGAISRCNEAQVAVVAGALTPTEVVTAWNAGADIVRIYPCGVMGGPAYVKFLRAPLPQVRLLPAGGVSLQTAADFIAAGAVAVEVDLDLVDLDALHGGRTQDIAMNARLYLDVMSTARSLAAPSSTQPPPNGDVPT